MKNRIFIDSSIFVEYLKGNNTLLEELLKTSSPIKLFFSSIVQNEVLYHYLSIKGGKSPRTLQQNILIDSLVDINLFDLLFENIVFPNDSFFFIKQVPILMKKYNLLPSDSQILSACILNEIPFLATLDSDFTEACKSEKIQIISNKTDLENILHQ